MPADLYGGTFRLVDKVLSRWGLRFDLVDQTDLDAARARRARRHAADLGREPDQSAAQRGRHRGRRRAAQARAGRRRQHVRDPGQPAPARTRRRLRRAFDDQVPGRPLRRRRRRGDRPRRRLATSSCGSSRTRSAPSRARSTASWCIAGCARCICGWRPTRAAPRRSSSYCARRPGVEDVRWPGFSGMVSFRHPDAAGDRDAHPAVHARRVARRRRVADRGSAGDDRTSRSKARRRPCRPTWSASAAASRTPSDLVADLRQALA